MEFSALVENQLPAHLRESVDALLSRKCDGDELASGPRIPEINGLLDGEIERLSAIAAGAPSASTEIEPLNVLFRSTLSEVWGGEQTTLQPMSGA